MITPKLNLLKNSFFNTLAYTISSVLWFFLIPFVIFHLGEETYGIWAIASLFLSITNLANLGLPTALTRSTAEALSTGKSWLLRWLIRATDIIYIAIILIFLLTTVIFGRSIGIKIFGIKGETQLNTVRILLPLMCPVTLLFMISISRKSVIDGFQEVYRSSQISMLGRFLNFVITLVTIWLKWGIWSLYAGSLAEYSITTWLYHWVAHKRINLLDPTPLPENSRIWPSFRNAIGYGVKLQVSSVFGLSMELFYKSFISHELGLAILGQFQVVWRLVQMIQGFLVSALRPVFSASAFLFEKKDWDHLLRLFNKSIRYALLQAFAVLILFFPFSAMIFNLWLGKSPDFQVIIFQALCFWMAASIIATPGFMYLMGVGYSGIIVVIQFVTCITSIGVALLPSMFMSEYPWILIGLSYALGGLMSLLSTQISLKSKFGWSSLENWRAITGFRIVIPGIILTIFTFLVTSMIKATLIHLLFFIFTSGLYLLFFYIHMPTEDRRRVIQKIVQARKQA